MKKYFYSISCFIFFPATLPLAPGSQNQTTEIFSAGLLTDGKRRAPVFWYQKFWYFTLKKKRRRAFGPPPTSTQCRLPERVLLRMRVKTGVQYKPSASERPCRCASVAGSSYSNWPAYQSQEHRVKVLKHTQHAERMMTSSGDIPFSGKRW